MKNETEGRPDTAMASLVDWLELKHKEIMACEAEAISCLDANNVDAYRDRMRLKAQLLAQLGDQAEPLLAALAGEARLRIQPRLKAFSASAATALRLGSVFYMSALLYRDDHKKGEPDNMELFISELKNAPR